MATLFHVTDKENCVLKITTAKRKKKEEIVILWKKTGNRERWFIRCLLLLWKLRSTEEEYNLITLRGWEPSVPIPHVLHFSVRPERHSVWHYQKNMEFVITHNERYGVCNRLVGVRSGKDFNKFEEMNSLPASAPCVQAPLQEESPLCIECRVKEIMALGSHHMFIADVVNVRAIRSTWTKTETGSWSWPKPTRWCMCTGYFELGAHIGKFGWSVEKKNKKW